MLALHTNTSTTMTSREIAELTGKEHGHVMRDIRAMFETLEIGQSTFGASYFNSQNKEQPMFRLPYDETICLLTGYDAKSRMAVIKRWQELESKQPVLLPQTYKEALQALVAAEEVKEQQALQIGNLSTALDVLSDWASILKVAKHNKVNEKQFSWRKLKAMSEQLGYIIKKAESPRFGYQNLYNLAAFKACYPQFNYSLKSATI
jgi:Rha family phage regulatory protein